MIVKRTTFNIFESFNKNVKFSDAVFNEFRKDNQLGVVTTTVRHKSIGTEEGLKTQENISILKNYIFRQRRCFKQQTKKS